MTRTIEIAANAAATSWTSIRDKIDWRESQWGGTAHLLEIGTGAGFDYDDNAGTIELPAKRLIRCIETATTPDTVLFKGRIADKGLARGHRFSGDAKQFDVSLDDNNTAAFGIPIDGWKRPAETGWARVQAVCAAFLSGSPRASTDIDSTTYAPNTNTVVMPAKTYTESTPANVIQECAETEGKDAWVTDDDELIYDRPTSLAYSAGLAITDDNPNLTDEFPPSADTRGSLEGNEFWSGATLKYGTGSGKVTEVRTPAEVEHDYWRTVFNDPDADATTAPVRLATMLDNQSIEEFRATTTLTLKDTQVDLIKRGHMVSWRSAATGTLTPRDLRVVELYWEPLAKGWYAAHVTVGVPEKMRPRVKHPPATPPVSEIIHHEITVDNGGLVPCGDPIGVTQYHKIDSRSGGIGAWTLAIGDMSIWTALIENVPWPSTPCGVSLGAWEGWARQYGALEGTAPSDAGCVMVRLTVDDVYPGQHGSGGFLTGSSPSTHGPVIIYGGMAGSLATGDISGSDKGTVGGGMVAGQLTADSSQALAIDMPRSAIPWGDDFRLIFAPGWYLATDWICVQDDISGGNASNCGAVLFHNFTLQPYGIAEGAFGWLEAAPQGAQDGSNTSYVLLGGYDRVEAVWRNGIEQASTAWKAPDGLHLQTVGWAPLPTDTVLVKYYVPQVTPGIVTGPVAGAPYEGLSLPFVARPPIPPLPALLVPQTDTRWGTEYIRISNVDERRHAYAKVSGWNCDMSKLLLGYSTPYAMLNGSTYAAIRTFSSLVGNAVWSNTDNNKMYGNFNGDPNLWEQDMTTDDQTSVRDFTGDGYDEVSVGDSEGAISDDDRYIALLTLAGSTNGMIVYDLVADSIVGSVSFGADRPDNCQISRLGNYVGVQWDDDGTGIHEGFWLYSRDLTDAWQLSTVARHWDSALDANGEEIAVKCSPDVVAYHLATRTAKTLLAGSNAYEYGHVSGRSLTLNGWIFLSTYDTVATAGRPGFDLLIAVKTDGSGTVRVFGFSNHSGDGSVYPAQPQATVSPDGLRMLDASPWGPESNPIYAYVYGLTV